MLNDGEVLERLTTVQRMASAALAAVWEIGQKMGLSSGAALRVKRALGSDALTESGLDPYERSSRAAARMEEAHSLRLHGDGGEVCWLEDDTLGINLNQALVISKVEVLCEGGLYGTPKLRLEIEAPLTVDLKPRYPGKPRQGLPVNQ